MSRPASKRTAPKPRAASEHEKPHGARRDIQDDELGMERLLFFSDAVFAIAITLLALEIRLPEESAGLTNQELLNILLGLWPKYLGYVISFLVIGSFWIAHHQKFRIIRRYDGRLILLNLLLLMIIAFIPFPTAVISASGNQTATIFYALTMMMAGLLSSATWWYALRGHRLVPADLSLTIGRRRLLQSLLIPAIFLVSVGLAFINEDLAKYFWLLLVLVNVIIH